MIESAAPPAVARFREALAAPARLVYAVELVPSQRRLGQLFQFADRLRDAAVSVMLTDGAGGHTAPTPSPLPPPAGEGRGGGRLAAEVAQIMGRSSPSPARPRRATSCWHVNALHDRGRRNVLVVTGDYPRGGRGSFPLDSVPLLLAATGRDAAAGIPESGPRRQDRARDLCLGAVVSPFKYREAEVWGQRVKAWKKWRAGASFPATQIGFDVRTFQELRRWLARDGMAEVPVLATVYLLHAGAARLLAGGRLPGVYLPPDLEALAGSLTGRAGRAVACRRAALLADVLVRGLSLSVLPRLEGAGDPAETLATVDSLAAQDWRESLREYRHAGAPGAGADGAQRRPEFRFAPERGFSLFPDGDGGLLRDGPEHIGDRASYVPPALPRLHQHLFESGRLGAWIVDRALAAGEAAGRLPALTYLEHAIKSPALGPMGGDGRIAFLQYRCPEPARGCGKGLLNGRCADATVDGRCEVDPARPCYWRLVMESALAGGPGDGSGGAGKGLAQRGGPATARLCCAVPRRGGTSSPGTRRCRCRWARHGRSAAAAPPGRSRLPALLPPPAGEGWGGSRRVPGR